MKTIAENENYLITREEDKLTATHKQQKGKITKEQFNNLLDILHVYARMELGEGEYEITDDKSDENNYKLFALKKIVKIQDNLSGKFCPLIRSLCVGKQCIYYQEHSIRVDETTNTTIDCIDKINKDSQFTKLQDG